MAESWAPTLEDIGRHIPSRTRDTKTPGSDTMLGTFTANTTPDDGQAQAIIDAAVLAVLSQTGPLAEPAPPELHAQARAAAEWRAAADIEIAYPNRDADVRVYDQLDARARYELTNLLRRMQGLGEGLADPLPYWSAPDPPYFGDLDPGDFTTARRGPGWWGGVDPGHI